MIHTLTIIIPVYNESKTILPVLEKVYEVELINGIRKEIIIINDGSDDDTEQKINEFMKSNQDSIHCLSHKKNQGKGRAIQTALKHVTGEYLIIQDGDLEYDPNDYIPLIEAYLVVPDKKMASGENFLKGNFFALSEITSVGFNVNHHGSDERLYVYWIAIGD